jgi:DNA-binding NarL/FixJ family response regulator
MSLPTQPENKDEAKILNTRDPFYTPPRITILNYKHWAYIQKLYRMSPREVEVAQLICQGFNNDQIAKDLKITHGTVKTHLRNIYRRVRVQNKIAMLLRLVAQVANLSAQSGTTVPFPDVDIEKQTQPPPPL